MKKKIMVLTVAGALASAAAAQNQYDALRFLGNDVMVRHALSVWEEL